MGLAIYGDPRFKMANVTGIVIPEGVEGERVRARLREDFAIEIGGVLGLSKGVSGGSAPWATIAPSPMCCMF